ncbi:hypothetical protein JVU11DRAFT_1181 [Chiua virens]|nr:hypothetical protein JVU11DRAFT_1181 [Chiua virens]
MFNDPQWCDQVRHVRGTQWEVTRIIFTLTRYLSFITSSLTCYGSFHFFLPPITSVLRQRLCSCLGGCKSIYIASVVFAEAVLIIRTYALWGRTRRVLFFLLFLAGTFIAGAEVTALNFKIMLPGDATSPYQFYPSFCAYRSSRNAAWEYGFLVLYEIVMSGINMTVMIAAPCLTFCYSSTAHRWLFTASLPAGFFSASRSVIDKPTPSAPSGMIFPLLCVFELSQPLTTRHKSLKVK